MSKELEFFSFEKYKKELLKKTELKEIYDELDFKYQLIEKSIEYRTKNNLTQTDLAKLMGTKQQNISRFERGLVEPTSKFISKLLHVINLKVVFEEVKV